MKELNKFSTTTKLGTYGIEVNDYLTCAQIQQIVNATLALSKPDEDGVTHDTWAERQQNIDMLLLYHATDIPKEELNSRSHEEFLACGLIDAVKDTVVNYYDIEMALEYSESLKRVIGQAILGIKNPETFKVLMEKYKALEKK